jgi:hypothetical protein
MILYNVQKKNYEDTKNNLDEKIEKEKDLESQLNEIKNS